MRVWLDPGHGSVRGDRIDVGTSHNGLTEVDYVLNWAVACTQRILDHELGLARVGPSTAGERQRAEQAKAWGTELALMLHVNASENPDVHGAWVFVPERGDKPLSAAANAVAVSMPSFLRRRTIATATETAWPRVAWCLDWYTARKIPAILIECGFATNTKDAEYLRRTSTTAELVRAISAGITAFDVAMTQLAHGGAA